MPAALDINRNEVEMNVRIYGVRETARMMGINENTVLAWAHRGGWLGAIPRSQPLPPSVRKPAIDAISGPKALANAMQDDSTQTRASALRTARRAVARVERCDDDELILPETADVLNKHVKTASVAGGWNAQTTMARINLTVTGGGDAQELALDAGAVAPATFDADWRESDEPSTDINNY